MKHGVLSTIGKILLLSTLGLILLTYSAAAAPDIHITNLTFEHSESTVDTVHITVIWNVTGEILDDKIYRVYLSMDREFRIGDQEICRFQNVEYDQNEIIFEKCLVNQDYYIKIDAMRRANGSIVESSDIYLYKVRFIPDQYIPPNFVYYSPANYMFYILDYVLGNGFDTNTDLYKIYDESTIFGRSAFNLISLFFFIGTFVWIVKIWPVLRATRIFPFEKRYNIYKESKSKNKYGHKSFNEINEIIKKIKLIDPSLLRTKELKHLIINRLTRRDFHGGKIHRLFGWVDGICYYFYRIYIQIKFTIKGGSSGKFNYTQDERLRDLPSYLLLETAVKARMENPDVTKVAATMENRAVADIDRLRKASGLNLIWGIAVTLPLLGLFGTVTGLSDSFSKISISRPGDPLLITNLGSGIFEALWTTILGLLFGILFMMIYYYYDYKLNRIYHTWEQFYIDYLSKFHLNMDIYLPIKPKGKRVKRRVIVEEEDEELAEDELEEEE